MLRFLEKPIQKRALPCWSRSIMSNAYSTFGRMCRSNAILLVLTVISIADGRQSFAGPDSRLHAVGVPSIPLLSFGRSMVERTGGDSERVIGFSDRKPFLLEYGSSRALASDAAILEFASIEPAKPESHRSSRNGVPPEVSITWPITGTLASKKTIVVKAAIADRGDGIGQVVWRTNGVVLSVERNAWFERIDLPLSSIRRSIAVERSLSLSCGMNRIEVIAYSAKPPFRSRAARVSIKWDSRDLMAVMFEDPAAIVCDEWNGRFT